MIKNNERRSRNQWKNHRGRAKGRWTPPEPEDKSLIAPSPTYESGSHTPTFSRGTKRDSSYEQLSQIPTLTSAEDHKIQIEELIINKSMEDVLGGDTEEFTPSYNELKTFMLKVIIFLNFLIKYLHWNLCNSIWAYFPSFPSFPSFPFYISICTAFTL